MRRGSELGGLRTGREVVPGRQSCRRDILRSSLCFRDRWRCARRQECTHELGQGRVARRERHKRVCCKRHAQACACTCGMPVVHAALFSVREGGPRHRSSCMRLRVDGVPLTTPLLTTLVTTRARRPEHPTPWTRMRPSCASAAAATSSALRSRNLNTCSRGSSRYIVRGFRFCHSAMHRSMSLCCIVRPVNHWTMESRRMWSK